MFCQIPLVWLSSLSLLLIWPPFPSPLIKELLHILFQFLPSYHPYLLFLSQAAAPMVPCYSLVSVVTPGYVLTSKDLELGAGDERETRSLVCLDYIPQYIFSSSINLPKIWNFMIFDMFICRRLLDKFHYKCLHSQ